MRRASRSVVVLCLCALSLSSAGCATYWSNRGLDLSDVVMAGITITPHWTPQFAARIDAFAVLPLGYSNFDGVRIGWANRQFGIINEVDKFWGVLAWGKEDLRIGEFNPHDPHLLRQDMVRSMEESGQPLPQQAAPYTVGFVGVSHNEKPIAWPKYGYCPKKLHLAWIGIALDCNLIDLADFILGWSTLDIVGDDAK